MLDSISRAAYRYKNYDNIVAERDRLLAELAETREAHGRLKTQLDELYVPPGHFFSPLPSLDEIRKDEARIFGETPDQIPAVDLNEAGQVSLLEELSGFYDEIPFEDERKPGLRYYFDNAAYAHGDGILLFCMIRHLKPRRVIEVGSGFSSCLILDTNELFFNGAIETTFIEPYPELLHSLITEDDLASINLVRGRLQDIDTSVFEGLQAGDFLFIDSTHVSKIDSDVNFLFFEILPRLKKGVFIHLHDVFYPFEYPKWWVYEGRGWNEAYLLRAFLQYNSSFNIVLMNTYLRLFHEDLFRTHMPSCLKKMGGSIWLQKI